MIAAGSLGYAIAAKKNSRKVAKTGRQVTDKPTPISRLPANQEATHTFDPDGSGPLPVIPVVKDEDGNINNAETGERIGQLGEKAFEKRYPDYSFDPLPPSSETPGGEKKYAFERDGTGSLIAYPVAWSADGNIRMTETGKRIGVIGGDKKTIEDIFEKRYPDYSLVVEFLKIDRDLATKGKLLTTQADIKVLRQRDDEMLNKALIGLWKPKASGDVLSAFVDADPSVATHTLVYPIHYKYDENGVKTEDESDAIRLRVIATPKGEHHYHYYYDGIGRLIGNLGGLFHYKSGTGIRTEGYKLYPI